MEEKAVVEISLREKALAELSPIEEGLADLRTKYGAKTYDCTTPAGMTEAKNDRATVRAIRYKIPHIEKDVTRQINEIKNDIKTKAAKLTTDLMEIEKVSDDPIKAEEQRRDQEKKEAADREEKRRNAHMEAITRIAQIPAMAATLTADEITGLIGKTESLPLENMEEFQPRAISTRDNALQQLRDLRATKILIEEERKKLEAEKAEAMRLAEIERAENERIRKENEFQAQIAAQKEAQREAVRKAEQAKLEALEAENKRIRDELDAKLAAEAEAKRIEEERPAAEDARWLVEEMERIAKEPNPILEELPFVETVLKFSDPTVSVERFDGLFPETASDEEKTPIDGPEMITITKFEYDQMKVAFRDIFNLCNSDDVDCIADIRTIAEEWI